MSGGLFYSDVKGWLLSFMAFHPTPILFAVFWIILMLLSLKGVDRRDELAHLTYAVTLMAIGICMYFSASLVASRKVTPQEVVILCAVSAVISGLRWGMRRQSSALEFMEQKSDSNKK